MGSDYRENPLIKYPEMFMDFLRAYGVATFIAIVVLVSAFLVTRYGRRRRKERRMTGEDARMKQVAKIPPKQAKKKLHKKNPALPAVTLTRDPEFWRSIASTRARWWVAGKDLTATHLAVIAMTETFKNQILFDPCAWNVARHREESAVILDVKRDLLKKYGQRLGGTRFAYDLTGLGPTSGINLIETPEMAATTAAALYSIVGVKNPVFNQGARDLFEGLASALGHSRGNIVELFECLGDPDRMMELAEHDERLKRAVSGPKRDLLGDFITSARLPLTALERPEVARVFSPAPGVEQPHFERKETVFVCIPPKDRSLALLAGAVVDNMYVRATTSRRGTYFLLDEAGSVLTIENLDKYLAVGRGEGAYFFLVLQDISQLEDALGRAKMRSILGGARAKFFGPSQDPATAEYLSELSGVVRVRRAVFEDDGFARTWKQFWHAQGASYETVEADRAGIMREHVYGMVPGWFYGYFGDPHAIELLDLPPMFEWQEEVLPAPSPRLFAGIAAPKPRASLPSADPPAGPGAATEPSRYVVARRIQQQASSGQGETPEPDGKDDAPNQRRPTRPDFRPDAKKPREGDEEVSSENGVTRGRACPACEMRVASESAKFCEECGGRL